MTEEAGSVVLLAEVEAGAALGERLAQPGRKVARYADLEELEREQPVTAIEALVVRWREMPNGLLLAALGRLAVEHPGMAKVALMDAAPPLPVASYLTGCGVDLVWAGSAEDGLERVAELVERIHEGTKWIATR